MATSPENKRKAKYNRKWREENPVHYAYLTLKSNAKRRGHYFNLTLDEFKQFCYRYKYIGKKGRTADGYGVDRIREEGGYTIDNIAIKKNGNNTKKYKTYDWENKVGMTVTKTTSNNDDWAN